MASLSGTPDSGSNDSYTFTVGAANGVLPNASQTFILTVTQVPGFTSPANAAFSVGVPGSFMVEARGNPVASFTKTGGLPSGVSFIDNGDGTATIAGTAAAGSAGSYPITITAANGIAPDATQNFNLTTTGATPTPTSTPTPTPSPTSTPGRTPTQLLNISTRLLTKTGDNVAIGGIHHYGQQFENGAHSRAGSFAVGLRIQCFARSDPRAARWKFVIATNDDWQDAPNKTQIPDGFDPADSREAIIVITLAPVSYTVIESAKNDAGGIGLVEIYDLDSAGDAVLANISTRGLVQTGDEVMIGGFILGGGTEGSTVVVRAIGPSLAPLGIGNALADPTLELHDQDGALVGTNDNWKRRLSVRG